MRRLLMCEWVNVTFSLVSPFCLVSICSNRLPGTDMNALPQLPKVMSIVEPKFRADLLAFALGGFLATHTLVPVSVDAATIYFFVLEPGG